MQDFFNRIKQSKKVNHIVMDRLDPTIESEPLWDNMFKIRFADEGDLLIILSLEDDAYKGYRAWSECDFRNDLNHNPYIVYVIVEDLKNQPVAMISGRFQHNESHISHVLVREAFQNKGIGSRMLDLWIRLSLIELIPKIQLEVRESNEVAKSLYFSRGFNQVALKQGYYSNTNEDALVLRRIERGLL